MTRGGSPLRFLGLVLGSWLAARAVFLTPAWLAETAVADPASPSVLAESAFKVEQPEALQPVAAAHLRPMTLSVESPPKRPPTLRASEAAREQAPSTAQASKLSLAEAPVRLQAPLFAPPGPPERSQLLVPLQQSSALTTAAAFNRWSLSTWAFVRQGNPQQLATAGSIGGSQVGARATYALTNQIALSARLYSPLSKPSGAEAALGLEVQPLRTVPVRLLTERRQALWRDGRSAFAVMAHGGVSEQPVIGPVRLDAYAQAGIVGLRSRDGFVDGALRLGVPVSDDFKVGLGAWGAAQPGAARLDLGPQASYRLPVLGGGINASLEWRVRVAGDARPGSGPALTLSTDF